MRLIIRVFLYLLPQFLGWNGFWRNVPRPFRCCRPLWSALGSSTTRLPGPCAAASDLGLLLLCGKGGSRAGASRVVVAHQDWKRQSRWLGSGESANLTERRFWSSLRTWLAVVRTGAAFVELRRIADSASSRGRRLLRELVHVARAELSPENAVRARENCGRGAQTTQMFLLNIVLSCGKARTEPVGRVVGQSPDGGCRA